MKHTASRLQIVLCAASILGVAVSAANAAERPNLNPGNWEVSMANEIEGMASMAPMIFNHCIKADQTKDAQTFADTMQNQPGKKCKISDFKQEGGDKWSWSFACESGASGTTEYLFSGATYEATTRISTPAGKDKHMVKMTQHIKGKRIGDC